MKEPDSGIDHDHAVSIGGRDNGIVLDGTACLDNVLHSGAGGAVDVVSEGDVRIGAECHTLQAPQPFPSGRFIEGRRRFAK